MLSTDMIPEEENIVTDDFYLEYSPRIRAIVRRILLYANMSDDIDDCVNAVFVELLSKSGKFDASRGNMEAFVTVISRSVALNYCKRNMHRSNELVGDDRLDFLLSPIQYEDEVEFNLLAESIISTLNKREAELFAMRYLYYYQPEEIAVALNIKRSAVDMRLSRLRDKIRKQLIKGGIVL